MSSKVAKKITGLASGCAIILDLSHPAMVLIKIHNTCSFLLSAAACNLEGRVAVSPSKRANSAAPPSPGNANAATVG